MKSANLLILDIARGMTLPGGVMHLPILKVGADIHPHLDTVFGKCIRVFGKTLNHVIAQIQVLVILGLSKYSFGDAYR